MRRLPSVARPLPSVARGWRRGLAATPPRFPPDPAAGLWVETGHLLKSDATLAELKEPLLALAAATPPTPVTLQNLYAAAASPTTPLQSLVNARFVHRELIARRTALLTLVLAGMPEALLGQPEVTALLQQYRERLGAVTLRPLAVTCEDADDFAGKDLVLCPGGTPTSTREAFAKALRGMEEAAGGGYRGGDSVCLSTSTLSKKAQVELDSHLDSFFRARIGLRFLADHYLESRTPREGFSGIIQVEANAQLPALPITSDQSTLENRI